jgi:hypothetical protein
MRTRYSIYNHPAGKLLCSANTLAEAAILVEGIRINAGLAPFRWKYYDYDKQEWFVPAADDVFSLNCQIVRAADIATDCFPGK